MSDTQARINKLRAIRKKMDQTLKQLSDTPAQKPKSGSRKTTVSKSIPSQRPKISQEAKPVRKSTKDVKQTIEVRPSNSLSDKPTMEQKFQFFILTRDLMLAASSRQLRNSFTIWKDRLKKKQQEKPSLWLKNSD